MAVVVGVIAKAVSHALGLSVAQAGVLDATTTSVPVVGQHIVSGGRHLPTKVLERPPHAMPPATWQLHGDRSLPGPLAREDVDKFFDDGFLFLPNFYDADALKDVESDVGKMIDNLAKRCYKAGKVKDTYADLDWTSRLLRLRQDFADAPVVLIKGGVLPVSLAKMFSDSRILDIAQQLGVGPDVALNPAWNLRGKMPKHEETVVPWHQDNSYWEPRIWDEEVLTVWFSLVDATVENGCLQMVKGAHKSGKTATHTVVTTTSTWYTEVDEHTIASELLGKDDLGSEKVTVEAKAGSILIFPGTTPHRSLNNVTNGIRWSSDFRLHRKQAARPGKSILDWFYGLKDSLLLREDPKVDPSFQPDFSQWANMDRTELQDEQKKGDDAAAPKENFDPIIIGPWMDLWDIEEDVRGIPNPHVDSYLQTDASTRDVNGYIKQGNW